MANVLSAKRRARIVACLVEGNSIRATCRMTGAAKGTVLKLLAELGYACWAYQDQTLRELPCKRVQVDEIWAFVGAKQKNVPEDKRGEYGDIWTHTAICADTKLVPCFMVGPRDRGMAQEFMLDLASRMAGRIQLTTDGHHPYLFAVEDAFGSDGVDYAMLVKLYGEDLQAEKHYSPAKCTGCRREPKLGAPDGRHISTSFVERQNLTMRMSMRRFTRLTNAFSKKVENLEHAVALHFMHYNFARIHQTLRVTPAMEAGVADHVWSIEEIVGLLR